jgi:serine/threonine protein kinase
VQNEITHLLRMRHPFIAHLFGYFQDEDTVNLILEYCAGGELYNRMKRAVKFTNDEARFYTAEVRDGGSLRRWFLAVGNCHKQARRPNVSKLAVHPRFATRRN